jgi:AbrB family looped-hinge helix DNA binding protein
MAAYSIRISSKGQVIIPAEIRKRHGLVTGTRAAWTEDGGQLILTPISGQRVKQIRGFLKPRPGEPSAFDGLFAERELERRREK